MKITVVACDTCEQAPAQSYTITASDGRKATVDLCDTHASPLEAILGGPHRQGEALDPEAPEPEDTQAPTPSAPKPPRARRTPAEKPARSSRPGRPRRGVVTLEEIEAKKRK